MAIPNQGREVFETIMNKNNMKKRIEENLKRQT